MNRSDPLSDRIDPRIAKTDPRLLGDPLGSPERYGGGSVGLAEVKNARRSPSRSGERWWMR